MPLKSALILRAAAIIAATGICAAVLLTLRPWREGASVEAPRGPETVAAMTASAPLSGTVKRDAARSAPEGAASKKAMPAGDVAEAGMILAGGPRKPRKVEQVPQPQDGDGGALTTQAMPKTGGSGKLTKFEADEALKPLTDLTIADSDLAALKEAAKIIAGDDVQDARPLIAKIKDPAAKKLALWLYYRAGAPDVSAAEVAEFRAANPRWPSRETLAERAEEALFWRESDPKKVLAYFREKPPVVAVGRAAMGGALIALGKTEEGRPLLRRAWREAALTPAIEARIKETLGAHLRPEDHKARIDYLLVQDNKAHLPSIERLLPAIDKKWEPAVKACMAVVKRAKKADAQLEKLDPAFRNDPAVHFLRVQAARRADKDKEVWDLLRTAPSAPEKLADPARWWAARHSTFRTALNEGDPKIAYAVIKEHPGDLLPENISDSEFLAGWVALRFLNQPKTARDHFMASAAAGGLPYRRARAGYWSGRAELALNNARAATARFAEAAQHGHTFYGQISYQMLDAKDAKLSLRTYVRPTAQEIKDFGKLDVMRALVLAKKADMESTVAVFLFELARNLTSAAEMTLTAELAQRITRPNIAVRMAKIAMNRGYPMEFYAYPDTLPQYKALSKEQNLEAAFVYAVARQESEFYQGTVSSAGAIGLLQVLPSTGKETAKAMAVKFEKDRLKTDPAYNISLGTAYLHQLMQSYNGSYVMTLAGYNAGPGRMREWVGLFGDPRDKKVDPIDWIERIPFTETREYVHKIMESIQVYRSRLDQKQTSLRLVQDIYRARSDAPDFMAAGTGVMR